MAKRNQANKTTKMNKEPAEGSTETELDLLTDGTVISGLNSHRVTLLRDSILDYPELYMDVFVAGDSSEQRAFAEMFVRARCARATDPLKADLVVFTGGEDVNPIFYDEDPHHSTRYNTKRDELDMQLYQVCLDNGIPMFGVCRGAQFLHVMNGGKLWQDIDGHMGDHNMWDIRKQKMIEKVSSVHHQACIPNPKGGMEILGDNLSACRTRWRNPTDKVTGTGSIVEAYFYRDTCCFGVQGHPEYRGYNAFLKWTLEQIQDLIVFSPDIEIREGVNRLKKEFILEREARWAKALDEETKKELN